MKIVIPSMGRSDDVLTFEQIPRRWLGRTYVVVREKEYAAYCRHIPKSNVLAIPNNVRGISAKRKYLVDTCNDRRLLMIDDDMKFAYRPDMSHATLVTINDPRRVDAMLNTVERGLNKYVAVGISARAGNNRVDCTWRECTRMSGAYAFDVDVLKKIGVNFGRTEIMEDFDVTLQLLRKGYKNAVLHQYCWNQRRSSNAPGGCSTWRTPEVQRRGAEKLHKLHPKFVRVVEKASKSGWDGIETRADVVVQWRKAYEEGVSNNLD